MDPASAAVAFVGFAASVITLCGLVVESSRTLYELQYKLRNVPDELRKLYLTVKCLKSMLLKIKRRSFKLEDLDISTDFQTSWTTTVSLLEAAMGSLRDWLAHDFDSFDLECTKKKQLLQRVKFFFADKKIGAFQQSLAGHISQLGLLQGFIISSQSRSLSTQIRLVPELAQHIREEINSRSNNSLQEIQGLRSDIIELRQTRLANVEILQQIQGRLKLESWSSQSKPSMIEYSSESSNSPFCNRPSSRVRREGKSVKMICSLPIGFLYYSRGQRKLTSTNSKSRKVSTQDELSDFFFRFHTYRLDIENGILCVKEPRFRRQFLGPIDPVHFRDCLLQGRVGVNDIMLIPRLGPMSILEIIIFSARRQPALAYQICEMLLAGGARLDTKSLELGSPLYIALEGNLAFFSESKIIYCGGLRISAFQSRRIHDLKAIPLLLLRYDAAFDSVPAYGDEPKMWSGEHGWLPRLMNLSNDPEYLRQVFFDNFDLVDIHNLQNCDRWLIAILFHTYPRLRATLEGKLFTENSTSPYSLLLDLEVSDIIAQVKAASVEDRCLLISSICRLGTAAMLKPFIQGDFELNEQPDRGIGGLHDIDRPYFFQAAKKLNMDIMKALLTANARIYSIHDFLGLFNEIDEEDCGNNDTIPFIDSVFAAFDFDGYNPKQEMLSKFLSGQWVRFRFEDPSLAFNYIVNGLIQRNCFFIPSPMNLDQIFGVELLDAIKVWGLPRAVLKGWILHIIKRYKTNVDFVGMHNRYGKKVS